ncbi:solute carrier organic anion transporter family member 1A2 [Orussus abietinus]|uniref:solute carrier organic anion transporter family member 1A2 n=1 Tax=Orussus abietinus TaxID=222816 RepID=UPI00062621AA|nr:solute carrier organic anion transporter family member 1A2 [Orussus abietinus]
MTIGPRSVVRSELEGGLSGPANPIPSESIDCGCSGLRLPKLARWATRATFLALICCIGATQAAAMAYWVATSNTIARRFRFHPTLMDWIVPLAQISPLILGLPIAYWGDRIHRAAWTGGLVLLQSTGYLSLLVPHFTHRLKFVEETENVTHMSLYSEDSPELCLSGTPRSIIEQEEPCYFTLGILIVIQILVGVGNIAFYALGISYLDDNTKGRHAPALYGLLLATRIIGILPGYILAWGCLRVDAENLNIVESYQEQIGGWWIGWPILATLLSIPGLLLAMFPRRLPSEVVQQAAESILDLNGRTSRSSRCPSDRKIAGSPDFFPSFLRLVTNKIVVCSILGSAICATAVINFWANEDIFLESRFYVPRPTGMLAGFGDPWTSRLITTSLRPFIMGLVAIVSGLVIARSRPNAKYIAGYNVAAIVLTAIVFLSLSFTTCEKASIVGERRGSLNLLKYCNKDCRCSGDADFRPVCDNRGTRTFYTACHAGCKSSEYIDSVKIYNGCSCVEEVTGLGNNKAREGACVSNSCQIGWLVFEVVSTLGYSLVISTLIGTLLIVLRSINVQDKALTIGLWMGCVGIFVHVFGKIGYQSIADLTCQHWGKQRSTCHLHDTDTLGSYISYTSAGLMIVGAIFQGLVCLFSRGLKMYDGDNSTTNLDESATANPAPLTRAIEPEEGTNDDMSQDEEAVAGTSGLQKEEPLIEQNTLQQSSVPEETSDRILKYGPLGPGDRRTTSDSSKHLQDVPGASYKGKNSEDELSSSDEDSNAPKKGSTSKIAYSPLVLDSDAESDLGEEPRSRKAILGKNLESPYRPDTSRRTPMIYRKFPDPDHYGDPRSSRNEVPRKLSPLSLAKDSRDKKPRGDFNEVGIPLIPLPGLANLRSTDSLFPHPGRFRIRHVPEGNSLGAAHPGDEVAIGNSRDKLSGSASNLANAGSVLRPPSRDQASSGFGSLPDVLGRPASASPAGFSKSKESLNSQSSPSGRRLVAKVLNTDL